MPGIVSGFSLGEYDGGLKQAVLKLKFEQKKILARPLSEMLASNFQKMAWDADLVVPVPMSPKRFRSRLFNPAAELGILIAKRMNRPYANILESAKSIHNQVGLGRKERLENVQGAFKVNNGAMILQKTILLIDDVVTTGATLSECAKELLASGATAIRAVAVAKEAPPG